MRIEKKALHIYLLVLYIFLLCFIDIDGRYGEEDIEGENSEEEVLE